MNLFPGYLTINNTVQDIEKYIGMPHTYPHEKELAQFLLEWYNEKDYIEVKTSGSTGTPKNIQLKKEFIGASAVRTLHYFGLTPGNRVLHCLPVRFIAGRLMVVRALIGNLNLRIAAPDTDFTFLKHETFKFAAMIPHQVQKIMSTEPTPGAYLNQIEQLLIGGSSIPRPLEETLSELHARAYSSYAMTETATHIALRKISNDKSNPLYHCLEGITVQEAGDGCLLIFMPGLPQQPLKTNDIARVIDELTFEILGRADNIIVSGGIKFSPELLEKKLEPFLPFPFLISSIPHDSLGEQLVLVAEGPENDQHRTVIREACDKVLEKYETPRHILFVPELPRTENGKIARKKVPLRI